MAPGRGVSDTVIALPAPLPAPPPARSSRWKASAFEPSSNRPGCSDRATGSVEPARFQPAAKEARLVTSPALTLQSRL